MLLVIGAGKDAGASTVPPWYKRPIFMTEHDTQEYKGLAYLATREPWNGTGDFTPSSITQVLDTLGYPQDAPKSFHIAGTNGKGSVSCMLASIAAASSAKTGLTVSPHLTQMHERIVVDGYSISNEALNRYAEEVQKASCTSGASLTYHEALTAIAFLAFAREGCDYSVIEVGLGGRLDSSNVIARPLACCITTIDYDHQDVLGETLTLIAKEKAGILKPDVPAIIGKLDDEALTAIEEVARERGTPLYRYGKEYQISYDDSRVELMSTHEDSPYTREVISLQPRLPGIHQLENAAVAAVAARIAGFSIEAIEKGIAQAFWPARLEWIEYRCNKILVDCAHNPHGVRALVNYLKLQGISRARMMFGALATKNWQESVQVLAPYVSDWTIVTPPSTRAVPAAEVVRYLRTLGYEAVAEASLEEALEILGGTYENSAQMQDGEVTVLTGSMYLIGALRGSLCPTERPLYSRYDPTTTSA